MLFENIVVWTLNVSVAVLVYLKKKKKNLISFWENKTAFYFDNTVSTKDITATFGHECNSTFFVFPL